jgi:phage tail-like protein
MLKSENFLPKVYSNSRDYKALLTLLDIVLNLSKYEIDNIKDLYDPMKCPVQLLPYLAEMVGYKYNNKDSVRENRIIIANFAKLIHYRGSEIGIKLAAALSLNSAGKEEEISDLQFLQVIYNRENATIQIFYPRNYTKVRNLMDYVRPVGMTTSLIGAMGFYATEQVGVTTEVDVKVRPFETGKNNIDNATGISEVDMSSVRDRSKSGGNVLGATWEDLQDNEVTWEDLQDNEVTWDSFEE